MLKNLFQPSKKILQNRPRPPKKSAKIPAQPPPDRGSVIEKGSPGIMESGGSGPPKTAPKTPEDALFADFLCTLFLHHFSMPLQDVSRALQDGPRRPKTATRRPKSRPSADVGGFLKPKSIQVGTRYASQSHLMLK